MALTIKIKRISHQQQYQILDQLQGILQREASTMAVPIYPPNRSAEQELDLTLIFGNREEMERCINVLADYQVD